MKLTHDSLKWILENNPYFSPTTYKQTIHTWASNNTSANSKPEYIKAMGGIT